MVNFVRENALFLGFLAALVGGFFLLRTREADLTSVNEYDALIGQGEPIVIEFYSNT
jgi:hypothetical protein